MADNEIRDLLLLTESFEEATARLAAAANQAGGKDNVTLVLGLIEDETLPPSVPGEDVASTLETLRQFSVGE